MDRYTVISADCHGGGAIADYRPYLPRRVHDAFDALAGRRSTTPTTTSRATTPAATGTATAAWPSSRPTASSPRSSSRTRSRRSSRRPSLVHQPPAADAGDLALRWEGLRAHNRWLADFCAAAPGPAGRHRADPPARRRRRRRRGALGGRRRADRRRAAAGHAARVGAAAAVRARLRAAVAHVRGAGPHRQPPHRQRARPTTATTPRPRSCSSSRRRGGRTGRCGS